MRSRWAGHVAAATVGALVAGAALLAATDRLTEEIDRPAHRPRSSPAPAPTLGPAARAKPKVVHSPDDVMLAWSPAGLPPEAIGAVRALRGVGAVAVSHAGVDWIRKSSLPDGTVVDRLRHGYRFPFDVAVIDPPSYAQFVSPAEREAVLALEPGEALLAETEADLRRGREGMVIDVGRARLLVAGVVSDVTANGYEALVAGGVPKAWHRSFSFILVHRRHVPRPKIERTIRKFLGPGEPLVTRARGEQPFLRYGDAVVPDMILKQNFGEFSARNPGTGTVEIDPRWRAQNIRTAHVPILGAVTCHRALFPQLRLVLGEIREAGIAHLIDPAAFAGCFSSRFINHDPSQRLSHHSWGIALDINASENPFGSTGNQDRRVIDAFELRGFVWGGRWAIPDAMHFEWRSFP